MSKKRRRLIESDKWTAWHPVRIGDLIKIFGARYGGGDLFVFPNDDAGRDDLRILLDHYVRAKPSAIPRVIKARAPWLTVVEHEDLLQLVIRSPRLWSAQALAIQLNLTEAERRALKVRTIGSVDLTPEERQRQRKLHDRARKQKARRTKGAKSRDEWLAAHSKSREKPWLALGIGRSAYYKDLKAGRGQVRPHSGQVRPQSSLYCCGHTCPRSKLDCP
jgi:hypothetical protein